MHISEGVLSGEVLAAGWALTWAGLAVGLRRMRQQDLPTVGFICCAFFLASLIHVPLGPTSVHLILNGLCGVLLGWMAFPALFVALLLQAVLFQFGGLLVLGVNTFTMATPAVAAHYLTKPLLKRKGNLWCAISGAIAAVVGVGGAGILVALSLTLSGKEFTKAAELILAAHIPVAAVEAVVTGFTLAFIKRSVPEVLGVQR